MGKNALLFPGQGVQFVGMGKDLCDRFAEARNIIDAADRILGMDLKAIMFEGPLEVLTETENAQPAIFVINYIFHRLAEGRDLQFNGAAGHSLGEYNALVAVGSIRFEDALMAVRERGRLMQEVGVKTKGTMAAILGLEEQGLKDVCMQSTKLGVVEVSNFNCPGQLVISGEVPAVENACAMAKKAGAKRAIKLNVSGAFHSSLLEEASQKLGVFLEKMEIAEPVLDFYQNVPGDLVSDTSRIREFLIRQVSSPVMWEKSIRRMLLDGYDSFTEVGPRSVLTGLVSQITPESRRKNIHTVPSVEAIQESSDR